MIKPGMIFKINYAFITGSVSWLHHNSSAQDPHLYSDPRCTCTSPLADDWYEKCSACGFNVRQVDVNEIAQVIEAPQGEFDVKIKLLKDNAIGWMSFRVLKPLDFPDDAR